jgi:hypothetical protein
MCTAILYAGPDGRVLLAGFRDEFTDRAWRPPAAHWPDYPGLAGGLDLLAGGTWLAVSAASRTVGCVLNGQGRPAPATARRSRGVLPLAAAAGGGPEPGRTGEFDPFHLLRAGPDGARLWSWDGERLADRALSPGLHVIVNSGLASELPAEGTTETVSPGSGSASEHGLARAAYLHTRLGKLGLPDPRPADPVEVAWKEWMPLLNGDGIGAAEDRALIVSHRLAGGRVWATTSVSLVAVSPDGIRYDFCPEPGNPAAWYPVLG